MTYLKKYLLFCKDFELRLVLLSLKNVAKYIAFLSERLQYTSIINYLTINRLIHLEANFPDPISTCFVYSISLGAKRVLGMTCSRKLAIPPHILKGIFTTINLT